MLHQMESEIMEWFRPLKTIEGLEDICKQSARLIHNGQAGEDSTFFTRRYRFQTSVLDHTDVKFIYNYRKEQYSVKFSIEELLDLLIAMGNRNGEINLPDLKITKQGRDIKIFDK